MSFTWATLRAVTTARCPRSSTRSASARPRPVEQPVMSQTGLATGFDDMVQISYVEDERTPLWPALLYGKRLSLTLRSGIVFVSVDPLFDCEASRRGSPHFPKDHHD